MRAMAKPGARPWGTRAMLDLRRERLSTPVNPATLKLLIRGFDCGT